MSKELQYLIEQARGHSMSVAEQEAQVRSFAYGNTKLENEDVTKGDIERAMTSLHAERELESEHPVCP
jgi:hypothetical protein